MRLFFARWFRRFADVLDPTEGAQHIAALEARGKDLDAQLLLSAKKIEAMQRVAVQTAADQLARIDALKLESETWRAELAKYAVHIPVPDDALLVKARELTAQWASVDVSGEFKRHHVLSSLMDAFPARSQKDMARAIEAAL